MISSSSRSPCSSSSSSAALTIATRAFFGVRTAVWVGLGIGTLVFLAFALIALFGVFTHAVAAFLAWRETRD